MASIRDKVVSWEDMRKELPQDVQERLDEERVKRLKDKDLYLKAIRQHSQKGGEK